NHNSIVILRGLESPEKIADLVQPYFDAVRPEGHHLHGQVVPLDSATFPMIWEESKARPGFILRTVEAALDLAAEKNFRVVDANVVRYVLNQSLVPPEVPEPTDASGLVE